ncbi:MAG: aminotransferase class V-fold PLP-dependent enzyme, partial [Youngiibacter sp.]|nr:aminotransferase class V-fold PLP-dependent enzyme [Youngiibacter sp.]
MKNIKIIIITVTTQVARSTQNEMGRETTAFGDPLFVRDFKGLIEDLKVMMNTDGEVFVVAGTGTMAMEMAVANATKRGDNVLLVSHGFFGDRFIDLCQRKGLNVDVLASEWGKAVPVEEIDRKLSEKKYAAITVTHVDTATGVCAPVAKIGEVMRKYPDTIYIVDGVCASAAEPEDLAGMGIDILLTGSQKAFGVSPG